MGSGMGSGMGSAKHTDNVPPVFETSRLRLWPWRDTDAPGPGEGPDGDSLRFMPAGAQPGPDDFPDWLARRPCLSTCGEAPTS